MDWEGIGTAILDRERARLGLPSRRELEEKRALEARAAAESTSGLETAAVGRDLTRAKLAALPAEQDLDRRVQESVITRNERDPQPRAEPSSLVERIMAMPPEQRAQALAIHRQMNPEPPARRDRLPIRDTIYDPVTKRNMRVWYDAETGDEIRRVPAALGAEESKRTGTVVGTFQAIDLMRTLANDPEVVPSGPDWARPVTGLGDQVVSEVTRTGKGADFDYAAERAKDIVYVKTGAQLNQKEEEQLERLTPRRDRGNIPEQVRRFEEYVRYLFIKYQIADETGAAPTVPAEGTPPSDSGARQRVLDRLRGKR